MTGVSLFYGDYCKGMSEVEFRTGDFRINLYV